MIDKAQYIKASAEVRANRDKWIERNPKPSRRHLNAELYEIALEDWMKEVASYDDDLKNIMVCFKNGDDLIGW